MHCLSMAFKTHFLIGFYILFSFKNLLYYFKIPLHVLLISLLTFYDVLVKDDITFITAVKVFY